MEATELHEVKEEKKKVDEGWYSYFLWVNWLVTYATLRLDSMLVLIGSAIYGLISFYIACRSKSIQFCLNLLPGILLSMYLTLKSTALIGGTAFGIALIAALYANRKRFLLIDWATLIPIKFISGKSTLGDDEHDYFAWED